MEAALLVAVLGVNMTFWTMIGGCRLTAERLTRAPDTIPDEELSPADVAVLIPAHNEEPVVAATISSALRLVPPGNVHVIADGCTDATAEIARSAGACVLELHPGRGKAGGIEAAVEHFAIARRFAVLLIVDADTELDEHYLERGLPLIGQPGVVAVAGYAKTMWPAVELGPFGRFVVAYRTRLYAVMQWLKYGQTWRWTNVTAIVPGFASMYRTDVLDTMDLNPPGLIIEDFNMTFEIHHKRLGKIAFRPGVSATTQDPDTFLDYYRQVLRWQLGLWQTIRRHGFWASGFSAALAFFLVEVLIASVGLVALVAAIVLFAPAVLASNARLAMGWNVPHDIFEFYQGLVLVLVVTALLDYILTCLVAVALRRPSLLLYGVGFLGLRFVDATAILWTLPMAWITQSSGRWTSPARRPTTGVTPPAQPQHPHGQGRSV